MPHRGYGTEYYLGIIIPKVDILDGGRWRLTDKITEKEAKKQGEKYNYYKLEYDEKGYPKVLEKHFKGNILLRREFIYSDKGSLEKVKIREYMYSDKHSEVITWILDKDGLRKITEEQGPKPSSDEKDE